MTDESETLDVPRALFEDLTEAANGYANVANADGADELSEEISERVAEAREILEGDDSDQ